MVVTCFDLNIALAKQVVVVKPVYRHVKYKVLKRLKQ